MLIKFLDGAQKEIADLVRADLRGANLCDADLRGTNLCDVNLRGANLRGANLGGANLRGANLCDADLGGANLRGANLGGADLGGANLRGANLRGAKQVAMFNIVAQGTLRVWKKLAGDVIAELEIPAVALRVNAYGSRKCRADQALVISLSKGKIAYAGHDSTFAYRVGETVTPKEPFCADPQIECASGIHFFITEEEAKEY